MGEIGSCGSEPQKNSFITSRLRNRKTSRNIQDSKKWQYAALVRPLDVSLDILGCSWMSWSYVVRCRGKPRWLWLSFGARHGSGVDPKGNIQLSGLPHEQASASPTHEPAYHSASARAGAWDARDHRDAPKLNESRWNRLPRPNVVHGPQASSSPTRPLEQEPTAAASRAEATARKGTARRHP